MKSFLSMVENENVRGIALGKFDGMHLAHRALFTHLPPQSVLLCIESTGNLLTPHKELFSPYPIISVAFEEIMQWSGEYFMQILKDKFPLLQTIVVGYDFAFGKDRAFNASDLPHLFSGEVIIVPQFCINGIGVHSSLIREFIRYGDMENANAMLGRYYAIQGRVITGQNLGAKALYATINLHTQRYVLPQDGVYASFTRVNDEILPSVCFVGHRLSTDRAFSIESHILEKEIYLKSNVTDIYFVQKIRDNQSFSDLSLLKKRITQDIIESKQILSHVQIPS